MLKSCVCVGRCYIGVSNMLYVCKYVLCKCKYYLSNLRLTVISCRIPKSLGADSARAL